MVGAELANIVEVAAINMMHDERTEVFHLKTFNRHRLSVFAICELKLSARLLFVLFSIHRGWFYDCEVFYVLATDY